MLLTEVCFYWNSSFLPAGGIKFVTKALARNLCTDFYIFQQLFSFSHCPVIHSSSQETARTAR